MFRVKDCMVRDVASVPMQATIGEVADLILEQGISGVPVVDDRGIVQGIVSEYDLLPLIYDPEKDDTPVAACVTRLPVVVDENDLLTDIVDLMRRMRLRRLPVVQQGQLVGLIARRDVLRFVRQLRRRLRSAAAQTALVSKA